jgi:hypothetical protein
MAKGNDVNVVIRQGRFRTLVVIAGVVAVLFVVSGTGLIDIPGLPHWFGGGSDDKAARGSVIYEGQEARSASKEFLIDIGDGEATVSVKAKQNHDKPGNVFSGDFQSTNGTSSVADPDDRGAPARLRVKTDYCAEGTITTTERTGDDNQVEKSIKFDMGRLYVCNATLEHTVANDAAFKQDDTPTEFHGRFVSFVAGAVETTAAAAACPTDELEKFTDPDLLGYVKDRLAGRFDVPRENVEVVPGTVGQSDNATKKRLTDQLENYANKKDPHHPNRTYEALSIQYLAGDGKAVDNSCYKAPGATDLSTLNSVEAPRPRQRP